MASSVALKRLVSSNIVPKCLRAVRPTTAPIVQSGSSRWFNTNAAPDFDDDDRSSHHSVSRRRDFPPNPFSVVFDPFSTTTTRSLSQILNAVDQFMDMESPILSASRGGGGIGAGGGLRRGWDARETDEGLYLRMDMPGLGKEDVKVSVEQNTLIIKGECEKEEELEEEERRRRRYYTSRIDLPEKMYKTDEIKAEMKNGVLKVVLPKLKEDDRSHVVHVQVE